MTEEIGSEKPVNKINYSGSGDKPQEATPSLERKPVRNIINPGLVSNKKPLGRKIAETFGGENMKSVGEHVVTDVILPKLKEMLFDSLLEGGHRAIFGSDRASSGTNGDRTRGTNYGRMYVSPNKGYGGAAPSAQQQQQSNTRGPNDFRDYIIPSRGQAEEVIDNLLAVLDQYGTVSVHELKEMIGITGEFTDQKWGWKNLSQAGTTRDRDGYRLDLPKVVSLD